MQAETYVLISDREAGLSRENASGRVIPDAVVTGTSMTDTTTSSAQWQWAMVPV